MAVGPEPAPTVGKSRKPLLVAIAALVAVAGVYGVVGFSRNPGDAACRPAVDLARRIETLTRGEVAAVKTADDALLVPAVKFHDGAGQDRSLADWRGRTVLLNLWATWCVPCRKEMPALDALQARLGAPAFRSRRRQYRHLAIPTSRRPGCVTSASAISPIIPTPTPRCSRTSIPSARQSACRRRCLSIPRAVRSPRLPAPPNGAARTASSFVRAALAR